MFPLKIITRTVVLGACLACLQAAQAATVSINTDLTFQTIEGFGAAGSASSDAMLDFMVYELGISMYRTGIEPRVLYHEVDPSEIRHENFITTGTLGGAFTRDVNFVRALQARRPEIRFVGSVWSPPPWMKYSGALTGTGAGFIGSDPQNHLRSDMYGNFAKFLVEYQKLLTLNGVPFYAIGPQNEPLFTQSFDSCLYTASEFANLVRAIGDAFAAEEISRPLIYGPEDMTLAHYLTTRHRPYVDALLEPDVSPYFDVFATHGYTDGVHAGNNLDPELYWNGIKSFGRQYWITEGGTGGHSWPSPITNGIGSFLHHALVQGNVSVFLGWQLEGAADEHHIMDSGQPTKKTYAAMHYWRYIRPGYSRVSAEVTGADSSGVWVSAFRDPAQRCFVLVAINTNASSRNLDLQLSGAMDPGVLNAYQTDALRNFAFSGTVTFEGGSASLTLPASSMTTLVDPEPVTGVSLEPAVLQVDIGGSAIFEKTVLPADATDPKVTWSTSNPAVASINGGGQVRGLKEGDALITMTSQDGGYTATANVQVRFLDWAGWPVGEEGWVSSGPGFLGQLHANKDNGWIFPINHNGWIYLPEEMVDGTSSWAFLPMPESMGSTLVPPAGTPAAIDSRTSQSTAAPAEALSNVALGKPVEASGEAGESVGANLVDGDWSGASDKRWAVTGYPQWAVIDLGELHQISEFRMYPYQSRGYQFTISVSEDGVNYTTVVDHRNNSSDTFVFIDPVDTTGRYLRFEVLAGGSYPGDWVNILELVAMGYSLTVPVSGVSVEPESLSRGIGQIYQLEATVIPDLATNKSVTWSTSNAAVATVDQNGKVTARGTGQAAITVTTDDGGFTDSTILQVNETGQWAHWPVTPDGIVDTGDFAGVVYVLNGSDWIYLFDFGKWVHLPEARVTNASNGVWTYLH